MSSSIKPVAGMRFVYKNKQYEGCGFYDILHVADDYSQMQIQWEDGVIDTTDTDLTADFTEGGHIEYLPNTLLRTLKKHL